MTETLTGWLFDLYPTDTDLALWIITDGGGRLRLTHTFPVAFHAAGPDHRLRALWKWMEEQEVETRLSRQVRRDAFLGDITVLRVEVPRPAQLDHLFRRAVLVFPDLAWYDGDISLALRYAAAFGVFPLSRLHVEVEDLPGGQPQDGPSETRQDRRIHSITPLDLSSETQQDRRIHSITPLDLSSETQQDRRVHSITPLDTPWELDPPPAPLRVLTLEPDCDPAHANPTGIIFSHGGEHYRLPLQPATALLANLAAVLRTYDPDLVETAWGDTWLLPTLLEMARQRGIPLPFNREQGADVVERKERTYFSYGQIVYRGHQVILRGRWHLDRHNATLWNDYGLDGVLEMARVSCQPVQEAARLSPGTGISAMQYVTALRTGILIPWHKGQTETPKSVSELIRADMGGMVYQPTIGLHRDVAGIDFVSMYPGIMVRFNISPEVPRAANDLEPASGEPGIVPQTLAPLLDKRLALKGALAVLHKWDCRRRAYQARASAHKWLLVTCFGYLGYKNARFGRIEAHEAVTAYGREALLRAKEAAENMDFNVLHMYVDGLWVKKEGCRLPGDFEALLGEVVAQTRLPISLDGIYRWVVFLPSRVNSRVPVANRYFGVFQDGSIKVRGIEARRRDTASFISAVQMALLEILARAEDADGLKEAYPRALAYLEVQLKRLLAGGVPLDELLVSQRLSRELEAYRSPSPAARAVQQLVRQGRTVRPGQRVRFLYTLGKPGVRAWDLPGEEPRGESTLEEQGVSPAGQPDPRMVDLPRYRTLLERAAETVLEPVRQSIQAGRQGERQYAFPLKVAGSLPRNSALKVPSRWVRGAPNVSASVSIADVKKGCQ